MVRIEPDKECARLGDGRHSVLFGQKITANLGAVKQNQLIPVASSYGADNGLHKQALSHQQFTNLLHHYIFAQAWSPCPGHS